MEEAKIAGELAYKAGEQIKNLITPKVLEHKTSRNDITTEADQLSERYITDQLAKYFPEDGIQAEEGGYLRKSQSGRIWIIDPLDGTNNFMAGLAHWGVSIALSGPEGLMAAAIYQPELESLTYGIKGEGSFNNHQPIRIKPDTSLEYGFNYLSYSAGAEGLAEIDLKLVEYLMLPNRRLRVHGASAVELCWLAQGKADAYLGLNIKWWDVASGLLIAQEAGAEKIIINQDPLKILVGGPAAVKEARQLIKQLKGYVSD